MKRFFRMTLLRQVMFLALLMVMVVALATPAQAYDVKQVWVRVSATAGETLTIGQAVAIKDADGYAYKADADSATIRPAIGIAGKGVSSGSKVEIIVAGVVDGWSGLTEGGLAYLSATAGAVTQTAVDDYTQPIGVAISATEYLFWFGSYQEVTLDGTQTLTNKTLTDCTGTNSTLDGTGTIDGYTVTNITMDADDSTISNIGSPEITDGSVAAADLAAPNSYFTMVLKHEGQEVGSLDPFATFQMPFAATLVEVSACARDIDTANTDETYVIDLEEAGTTVLTAGINLTADNTPVVGSIADAAIADNAKMEATITAGGTSPAIDDLVLLLTFKVAHVN